MRCTRLLSIPFLVCAWLAASVSAGGAQEEWTCEADNSEPTEIVVNGAFFGDAPAQLQLEAGKQYEVIFRRPGYEKATTFLRGDGKSRWVVLDVFSGVLGYAYDTQTQNWTFVEMVPEVIIAGDDATGGSTAYPQGVIDPGKSRSGG